MDEKKFEQIEQDLCDALLEKAENELNFRNGEIVVKKLNALANIRRQQIELMKVHQQEKSLELEERRIALEEFKTKYEVVTDMIRKSNKIQKAISKTMLGIFPEEDKQVLAIYRASKKLTDLTEKNK